VRFSVVIDSLDELIRLLTFPDLVVATSLYYLLIRRRRRQGDTPRLASAKASPHRRSSHGGPDGNERVGVSRPR
jgi:hypothetical protein